MKPISGIAIYETRGHPTSQ